jgi:hypothetical protein
MTTVAFDGKILAADSRVVGDYYEDGYQKIFKQGSRYYGVAGDYTAALLFLRWANDRTKDKPDMKDDKFDIIEVVDGKAYYYDCNFIKMPLKVPCAFGSGSHAAMAAMMCGKDAKEAVNIAKRIDHNSGGKVQSVTIKKNPRP